MEENGGVCHLCDMGWIRNMFSLSLTGDYKNILYNILHYILQLLKTILIKVLFLQDKLFITYIGKRNLAPSPGRYIILVILTLNN